MKPSHTVLILSLALLGTGCVSKKTYESVQTELATCQEEKAQAEAQVITWEQRFDREAQRWESVGASISEQVPKALSELHDERERIVKLVPEQVQGEVEKYLDEYFATVMTAFDRLSEDNNDIKMQLSVTQQVLESLGANAREVSTKIDTTLQDERSKRREEQQKRENVASRIADVVTEVTEFNNTRVNCKQCPNRLKLNRKERETITTFHNNLTTQLSQIQTFAASDYSLPTDAGGAPAEEEEIPTEEVSEPPGG